MVMILMKLSNTRYIIKNNYKLIIVFLLFVYLVVVPLCITAVTDNNGNREIIVFNFMQELLLIPCLILLSYQYSQYVESEYKEIIYSLDRSCKYIYIIIIYMFIQILLFPFYIGMTTIIKELLPYVLVFQLQMMTLFNVYYLLSKLIDISFVILGCMICYMLVYLFMLYEIRLGNIFIINTSIELISRQYYISIVVVSILSVVCGIVLEKRKFNLLRK